MSKRPVVAEIYYNGDVVRAPRYYARLETVVPGVVRYFLEYGKVGEKCVVYHRVSGVVLGNLRFTARGHLKVEWEK